MADAPKADAVKADAPKVKADADLPLSSDPSKDPSKPSRIDHGKAPKWLEDQRKAQEEAAKDPWGSTPDQSRGKPDEFKGTAAPVNGIDPHLDDNEHIVGGTLPPV